jgi:hypothetical protein
LIAFFKGIATEIGPDKCKLVINDGVGHMPPIEDPTHLCKAISDFVSNK